MYCQVIFRHTIFCRFESTKKQKAHSDHSSICFNVQVVLLATSVRSERVDDNVDKVIFRYTSLTKRKREHLRVMGE